MTEPKHKKFYYKPFAFVGIKDFRGADAFPIDIPREFMSRGGCEGFIDHNVLNAEWPEGYPVPSVSGACDPICFCAIYRRQLLRGWFRRPSRSLLLLFAGFERMRRSVAEESVLSKGGTVTRIAPEGYHFAALWAFIKSLSNWLDISCDWLTAKRKQIGSLIWPVQEEIAEAVQPLPKR